MNKIKLGDVLEVKRGMSLPGEYYATEGDYIRLTLGNFNYPSCGWKKNVLKDNLFFTGNVRDEYILKKGDIITPLTEQVRGLLGNTATIPEDALYIQSGDIGLIIPDETKLDKRFSYYLVSSSVVKKQLDARSQQTKIRHTSPEAIKDCVAFIPIIKEQKKISYLLDCINKKIENNNAINDNLVAVGTASIQKNVGRGALINLTEAEMDRLTLPDGFEIQTVSEFCRETKSGSTPSRTNNEYWENGTISWVKSGEVHNNITLQTEEYITPLGLNESSTKLLPKDTVLMAMYGVTAGEIGYLAIEATTNQAICGMICNSKANAAYLYFSLIQSQTAISRLSNGGAQDNLSKNFIDNIKIVVPPSEFIEKMKLAAIVEQMTLNTKEIAILEELQATALAQLSSY